MRRISIDANNASVRSPGMLSVLRREAPDAQVGERVIAVQDADPGDDCDFIGDATVDGIDEERGLVFLKVDWSSFRDEA